MNRLIVFRRIIADIAGGVRKPVGIISFWQMKNLPDPRKQLSDHHIMHISSQRHTCPGKNAAKQCRFLFFPAIQYHLAYQTKRNSKAESSHQCPHQIVGLCHLRMRQLCQEYGKILSAVIVIDLRSRIPQILRRKCGAAHHRHHKSIIHEFLSAICRRAKSCYIRPEKKQQRKDQFIVQCRLIPFPCKLPEFSVFILFLIESNPYAPADHSKYRNTAKTASRCKRHDPGSSSQPHQKSSTGDTEDFCHQIAFITESGKQILAQWKTAPAQQ